MNIDCKMHPVGSGESSQAKLMRSDKTKMYSAHLIYFVSLLFLHPPTNLHQIEIYKIPFFSPTSYVINVQNGENGVSHNDQ